ncbi:MULTISPECIES: hypothetical protein [Pseudomonas]|uniref:Uncharacterized protein n=1 Tax=Pseudomonas fluorescens TaxID=294 RepID=A0A5E6SDW5_PSEFL|nr:MULTISPECIES: hypothetical protein [Pseudomonas]VVM78600.1 hypothetical protein PS652_02169 [Pseudomonas fluorescens]
MDRHFSLQGGLIGLFLLSGQALAESSYRHEFTLDNGHRWSPPTCWYTLVQISVGPTVEQDALPEIEPATG